MDRITNLLKINEAAQSYFQEHLPKSKIAQEYLLGRISQHTADKFKVGYAPFSGLLRRFLQRRVDLSLAEELGLIQTDYNDISYEFFSNRVMVPIYHAGMLLGFGGRTLSDKDSRKYINSKTSILYNKKEILYGLDTTRKFIVKYGYALVVEGYFDVLGLYDAGVTNCVAVCGSNLTLNQARLLSRYAGKVFTLFDGDDAGRESGVKSRKVLQRMGIFGGCLLLPRGYDPDTFIKKYGKNNLKNLKVRK